MKRKLIEFSLEHYKFVTITMLVLAVIGLAQFPKIVIDTDPENMLPDDEFVRMFDRQVKKDFMINDMIILGVVNEIHPQGVFNVESLAKIHHIVEGILQIEGVVAYDVMALSTVDDVRQGESEGEIRFQWLMDEPPATETEAQYLYERVKENPFLYGTLVSEDGNVAAIYVPLEKKTLSYQVSQKIKALVAQEAPGGEQYHISGMPVAQDTFGYEMFSQMIWAAPLAGLLVFALLWYFFRNLKVIIAPMVVALVSIIYSMGLLIGLGYTVHIMSSMIAIFLMPIAVVDSVHIVSAFFDEYQKYKDRKKTMLLVMDRLFSAMLYTSLTTFAGFVSLASASIPPVQVFGVFVGVGIASAWLLTVTFIPASVMFLSEETLEHFGSRITDKTCNAKESGWLSFVLDCTGRATYRHAKLILAVTIGLVLVSIVGISKTTVNDNPVKWFDKTHPIRVADRVMNAHFGGTYLVDLVFEQDFSGHAFLDRYYGDFTERWQTFREDFGEYAPELAQRLTDDIAAMYAEESAFPGFRSRVSELIARMQDNSPGERSSDEESFLDELTYFWDDEQVYTETFKQPEMLTYIDELEEYMLTIGVGNATSLTALVKKVYQELRGGAPEFSIIPGSAKAVGATLMQYQNSHRPNDMWHLVTPDFSRLNLRLQLRSGDNKDMVAIEQQVNAYIEQHPSPIPVIAHWAGSTYLNVTWQKKMVRGMLNALIGSYIVVLIMMIILFRSPLWGLLSMIPLTVTIGCIYGFIGFIGKDYDMPIAVLSSLTLGLSVDFAIHFLERSRQIYATVGSWEQAAVTMFHEPARAIARNIIVIALGFLPLLFSVLTPYQTVGFFLSSIMLVSGVGTLFILPAMIKLLQRRLFSATEIENEHDQNVSSIVSEKGVVR